MASRTAAKYNTSLVKIHKELRKIQKVLNQPAAPQWPPKTSTKYPA